MKKFLMVLLSIAFVLNLAIVIGLIGGYGSPRRALYTITDELMNSAYRFKRGWQFKNGKTQCIAMYIGAGEDMAIWLHGNSLAIIWTFTRAFLNA